MSEIRDSIVQTIGDTPMIRLSRIGRELDCELLGKCEFLNAGGSVKDRIGASMIEEAERSGRIRPGDTLIEPTSGNTGIGLAMVGAVKGYRMIITMPEKMSREKQVVLEALGAEIIRTPNEAAWDSPESHIGVANRLKEVIPRSHILDQYSNPANPDAHEYGTGEEILRQTGGRVDMVVIGAGTGGTITGIARRLKKELPEVRIVGVDPIGSILGGGTEVRPYKVEGIGYDFMPEVLDLDVVDQWVKVDDRNSFLVARRLIRDEGLLCGGSSGSAAWAALRLAAELGPDQRCVVVLPDNIRNYMTKFVDDKWMKDNHFVEPRLAFGSVGDIVRTMPDRELYTVAIEDTISTAVDLMKAKGVSQLPVLDQICLAGIVTEHDLLSALVDGRCTMETSMAEVMNRQVSTVSIHDPASKLTEAFAREEVGLVLDDAGEPVGIITKMDLVEYMTRRKAAE